MNKPSVKQIRAWLEGAISAPQDCFDCTDWTVFREAATTNQYVSLTEYTESVTGYIYTFMIDVTIIKNITTRANYKPWFTKVERELLRAQNAAFKAGDKDTLRSARANLNRGVRTAKHAYRQKIQAHFPDTKDPRCLWQGIQSVTDYRPAPPLCEDSIDFLNTLKTFFSRFEETTTPPKPLPARTMKHFTWTQLTCGPYSRGTPGKLQVLTTFWGVCSETVVTNSQMFLRTYTTPL